MAKKPTYNEVAQQVKTLEKRVAKLKGAEKVVREKEAFCRSVFNSIQDGISVLDKDLNILLTNLYPEKWYANKMPIVGKKCYAVYHDRTEPCEICPSIRTLSSGKPDFEVIPLITKEETYWFETYTFPLYDFKTGQISGVIEYVRNITKRKRAEEALRESNKALKAQTQSLEELNAALRVVIERREEDKAELEEKVLSNVKELILPYIETLRNTQLDKKQMTYVEIIESNLKDIVSPLLQKLALKYSGFTPKEIQVAGLIKQGKTTKEIAEFFNLSTRTIKFHRQNIRAKLGLKNQQTNLASYLLSLS